MFAAYRKRMIWSCCVSSLLASSKSSGRAFGVSSSCTLLVVGPWPPLAVSTNGWKTGVRQFVGGNKILSKYAPMFARVCEVDEGWGVGARWADKYFEPNESMIDPSTETAVVVLF